MSDPLSNNGVAVEVVFPQQPFGGVQVTKFAELPLQVQLASAAGPPGPPGPPGEDGEDAVLPPILTCDEIYIGPKMRFVQLPNGGKLEVQGSDNVWNIQAQWTEA
jgi:hypothetical protein